MARRRYLISYDISDPKRLRATFNVMKGYGKWLQYSVFVCDLSKAELAMWERDIRDVIALAYDSVVVIDLGAPQDANIRMLGVPRRLPDEGPVPEGHAPGCVECPRRDDVRQTSAGACRRPSPSATSSMRSRTS